MPAYKVQSIVEGNQGRSLEAGMEPEAMKEHCLRIASRTLLSLLPYTTLNCLSGVVVPPIVGRALPHQF